VKVIFGPYTGKMGVITSRRDNVLVILVKPPCDVASTISVRIDDIKFID
jgi:hypothetical protein